MKTNLESKPILFVLSSPSGGGKTSLSKNLLLKDDKVKLAISATTRPPRIGEEDGVDYHFLSNEQFDHHLQQGQFLETTKIYNASYGTMVSTAKQALGSNHDTLFMIDWDGAAALKKLFPEQVVTIFITPPNLAVLEQRLMNREGQNSNSSHRLAQAKSELKQIVSYDYILVNDDMTKTVANLQSILKAERIKLLRIANLEEFIENF